VIDREDILLTVWVIYDHPSDYPNSYVLRPQVLVRGQKEPVALSQAWTADTPDQLRRIIPPGLHRLDRQPDDHPQILETWI